MAKVTYDICADGIQQGTINSSGNTSSTTRVRSRGRFEVPALASKIVTVEATCNTGKQLSVDLMGYINSSTNSYVFDDCWYNISTSTNTYVRNYRNNPTVNYMRFVLKYVDGSDITPSEITSFEVTVEDIWQADANDNIYSLYNANIQTPIPQGLDCDDRPLFSWCKKSDVSSPAINTDFLNTLDTEFSRPFPFGYWRIDDGNNGETYTELFLGIPRIPHEPPSPDPPVPPGPEYEEAITMQYDIYCDGQLMHSSVTPEMAWKVIDPVLDLQDSAAGSLEFSLPPFNNMYGKCQMMMSTISVRRNGVEIWEGRPVSFKEDMWLNHPITCEGELAYLNDIYQRQTKYENVTLQQLLYAIIGTDENGKPVTNRGGYNARASENRRFAVRTVESTKYQSDLLNVTIPFQTTLESVNSICKTYGLHIYIDNVWTNDVKERGLRFESDGLGENRTQTIEFGKNLVDYSKSYNFSEIVTYVLPLGAKSNKAGATVKDNDEKVDVKAAGFEQGSIVDSGDYSSATRVRSKVYLTMPSGADSIKVSAESDKVLKVSLVVYKSDKTTQLLNSGWQNTDEPFDISNLIGAAYYRVILRYDDSSDIEPNDVTSCSVVISKTRKGTGVGTNGGRGYVIWPSNKKDSEGNSHNAGDIVSLSGITDYGSTDEERNKHYVYEYVITEENSTVFITTKMNNGAGMAVVHNDNNHYYIKKAGSSSVMTAWTDIKYSGWYSGFTGTTKMYVAGYGSAPTVVNSKVVDEGLEEYVTVEGISTNPDQALNNVDGLYVRDTDATQYDGGVLPVDIYGRIERKIEWPDATDGATLYNNAITYLRSGQFDGLQIELTALDLSMLGFNANQLKVGEMVRCKCPVYGLDKPMPITAIKIPLTRPDETKYTVGSTNKQNLTSVNNANNSELLSLIAEKPSISAVMSAAKSSAAQYIMDTNNGYVTMRYAEDGHPEAIIVSDTEDYRLSPNGYWLFGKHGLGYILPNGTPEEEQAITNVALKNTGEIVADRILTGTMSAERIFGDTLKLGLLGTESGNMKVYDGSLSNQVAQIDKDGIKQWSGNYWVIMNDGKVTFGDSQESQSKGIFLKGNGNVGFNTDMAVEVYADSGIGTTAFGIATDKVLVYLTNALSHWSTGYYETVTEEDLILGNKKLLFVNGLLTKIESASSTLYSGNPTVDGKTFHISNGLITDVTTESNNNNNE